MGNQGIDVPASYSFEIDPFWLLPRFPTSGEGSSTWDVVQKIDDLIDSTLEKKLNSGQNG